MAPRSDAPFDIDLGGPLLSPAAIAEVDRPIATVIDGLGGTGLIDVAIDFSQPDAVAANLAALAARGISVVIGTTGWHDRERDMRETAGKAGIGVRAAAYFSLGMHVFAVSVEEAARRLDPRDARGRLRWAGRDGHPDARGARPIRVRPWRPRGRQVAARPHRLVHHA